MAWLQTRRSCTRATAPSMSSECRPARAAASLFTIALKPLRLPCRNEERRHREAAESLLLRARPGAGEHRSRGRAESTRMHARRRSAAALADCRATSRAAFFARKEFRARSGFRSASSGPGARRRTVRDPHTPFLTPGYPADDLFDIPTARAGSPRWLASRRRTS